MDIFGIGGAELILIIVIMLIVAGPKRMIQWSYILGRYVGMLRRMWAQTAVMLQKELDDAGVDVKVPKDIPTRGSLQAQIRREVEKAAAPVTRPFQESMKSVQDEVDAVRTEANLKIPRPAENGHETPPTDSDFGTWSGKK